jgi:hypothetical protein
MLPIRYRVMICAPLLIGAFAVSRSSASDSDSGGNCTFQASRDSFLSAQSRARTQVFDRTKLVRTSAHARPSVDVATIPRRSFIDDEIFGALAAARVQSAPLATDEEFLRRATLDLTGRLPSPAAIRDYMADPNPGKRYTVVDQLLWAPGFVDKWTMWMGDWLRNAATNATSYSPQGLDGRNAFYKYIWSSVSDSKGLRDVAYEILSATGNNYEEQTGNVNFLSSAGAPGGPAQDTYDALLVKSTTAFLGLGHYDCLLCHNGRGHLDQLSVWGKSVLRQDAEKMAAFYSRTNLVRWTPPAGTPNNVAQTNFFFNSYAVQDVVNRTYDLNTNYGNRPNRVSSPVVRLTPEYRGTAAKPADNNWRLAFAGFVVDDPMFSRNIVNRVWKQMFNLALAEPVDGLDPARLDPNNPPDAPWTLQATHPQLMEKLSAELIRQNYSLRELLRLIVTSSAYQLSSEYDGEWKVEYIPLFARHYPRRLDGEEVHDAVCASTGVFNTYVQWSQNVTYAMQLLDSVEPRNNLGNAATFMNYFLRGNRDTQPRSQNTSVQQGMALMNDGFVTNKIHVSASPVLQAVAKLSDNNAIVDELFLRFISRKPSDWERGKAVAVLSKATTAAQKNAAIEDLAWALINKIEFLFSY